VQYLNIPEVTESEEMLAVEPDPDGVTFRVTIRAGDVAQVLFRAADRGEHFPLVVLAMAGGTMLALDSVYVASVSFNADAVDVPLAEVTFHAASVRFF
jgi:hypothetical protein